MCPRQDIYFFFTSEAGGKFETRHWIWGMENFFGKGTTMFKTKIILIECQWLNYRFRKQGVSNWIPLQDWFGIIWGSSDIPLHQEAFSQAWSRTDLGKALTANSKDLCGRKALLSVELDLPSTAFPVRSSAKWESWPGRRQVAQGQAPWGWAGQWASPP